MFRSSQRGLTVWLTGLPGSGKTTSALALLSKLKLTGRYVAMLDGDVLRDGVSSDLGFSYEDRDENVRRAGEIALFLAQQSAIVIVSLVSPHREARDAVRERHVAGGVEFFEVHIAASLDVCEQRDPKDLYRRSHQGLVTQMTGVDDPYEVPLSPELVLQTGELSEAESGACLAAAVFEALADLDSDKRTLQGLVAEGA